MRNKIESRVLLYLFFLPLNNQSDFVEGINKKVVPKFRKLLYNTKYRMIIVL